MRFLKFSGIYVVILHVIIVHENLIFAFARRLGLLGDNLTNSHTPLVQNNVKKVIDRRDDGGGIMWENLKVVAQDDRQILNPSSGFIANGHVCGILGPCT